MATGTMTSADHRRVAVDFLDASEIEFEAGDVLQGAEKLWGAAAHAMMSVALEEGWSHGSHRALKNAAIQLSKDRNDPLIEAYFGLAEKFHRHFYHDSMEDWERDADRPLVHDLVRRVLRIGSYSN